MGYLGRLFGKPAPPCPGCSAHLQHTDWLQRRVAWLEERIATMRQSGFTPSLRDEVVPERAASLPPSVDEAISTVVAGSVTESSRMVEWAQEKLGEGYDAEDVVDMIHAGGDDATWR